jgi:RNA polymerase II-associated protein 3
MMADPKDATFPLNRAAAYLKLSKCVRSSILLGLGLSINVQAKVYLIHTYTPFVCRFQDAERDCTKVLSLDLKNVKALFRRGQARAGLGNYQAAKAGQYCNSAPERDQVL